MTTMQKLGLDKLSVEERLSLIGELWDSVLDGRDDVELTPEQEAELDRRLDLQEADPKRGSSWEEVKARIRAAR
jgi:putative addiction module component (TIGR02574 family)